MNVVNAGLISHLAILLDSVTTGPECVFVFAATNRPDVIEPALLRPGTLRCALPRLFPGSWWCSKTSSVVIAPHFLLLAIGYLAGRS